MHLSLPLFNFTQWKDKCTSCSFTTKKLTHSMCQLSLVVKYIYQEYVLLTNRVPRIDHIDHRRSNDDFFLFISKTWCFPNKKNNFRNNIIDRYNTVGESIMAPCRTKGEVIMALLRPEGRLSWCHGVQKDSIS